MGGGRGGRGVGGGGGGGGGGGRGGRGGGDSKGMFFMVHKESPHEIGPQNYGWGSSPPTPPPPSYATVYALPRLL